MANKKSLFDERERIRRNAYEKAWLAKNPKQKVRSFAAHGNGKEGLKELRAVRNQVRSENEYMSKKFTPRISNRTAFYEAENRKKAIANKRKKR